jgi:uncharacterized Zn finger protein
MRLLPYPLLDVDSTFDVIAADAWRRGISFAQEGRVLSCVWDPQLHSLFGGVDGDHGQICLVKVRLSRSAFPTWNFKSGSCSCPAQLDCEHVAAIVIAAVKPTVIRKRATLAPPW